jgi:integrase
MRYRALVLVAVYGGLRIGGLAGLRRSRVDLLRGIVQMTEIEVEVQGVLHVGPPRTRASRLGWVASGRGKELLYDLPSVR